MEERLQQLVHTVLWCVFSYVLLRIMSELRTECETFDKNTTDEAKHLKEAMDMRRLNFAFNILGVEPETQIRALEM